MCARRGFTLIELMVVIGIITVLAAIIYPVFASARGSARRMSCSNNMKQVGLAVLMYAADHDDKLPRFDNGKKYPERLMWYDFSSPYLKKGPVFKCPELSGVGVAAGDPNARLYWQRTLGFGINRWHGCSRPPGNQETSLREAKHQSRTMMLADSCDLGYNNPDDPASGKGNEGFPCVYCPFCYPKGLYDKTGNQNVAPRHNKGCNVFFLDGHSKWYPIEDAVTTDEEANIWGHDQT